MTREEQLQRESEVYAWTADQFDIQLAFKKGVEWEHKRLVEEACEWLELHINDDKYYSCIGEETLIPYLIDDFRKAMEE